MQANQIKTYPEINALNLRDVRAALALGGRIEDVKPEYREDISNRRLALLDRERRLVATGQRIEAYGQKGLASKPWRKTFKNAEALCVWVEKNDAMVLGTRDEEAS